MKEKPLLAQYRRIKAENEGCVLMFRLGGFFVMFQQDAYIASTILGLKVISRNMGEGSIPACGVPPASVMKHARTLAEMGYSVAICNQMEGDSEFAGVKNRVVTETIRPQAGIPHASPVPVNVYDEFCKEFYAKEKKQRESQPRVSSILNELNTLDLDSTTPTSAWALLYHWKRMYCNADDGL